MLPEEAVCGHPVSVPPDRLRCKQGHPGAPADENGSLAVCGASAAAELGCWTVAPYTGWAGEGTADFHLYELPFLEARLAFSAGKTVCTALRFSCSVVNERTGHWPAR